jgi:hypothetical protein
MIKVHNYYPFISIELLEATNKGWKVKQTETEYLGKKLKTPKIKIAFYSSSEIYQLFKPQ